VALDKLASLAASRFEPDGGDLAFAWAALSDWSSLATVLRLKGVVTFQ